MSDNSLSTGDTPDSSDFFTGLDESQFGEAAQSFFNAARTFKNARRVFAEIKTNVEDFNDTLLLIGRNQN